MKGFGCHTSHHPKVTQKFYLHHIQAQTQMYLPTPVSTQLFVRSSATLQYFFLFQTSDIVREIDSAAFIGIGSIPSRSLPIEFAMPALQNTDVFTFVKDQCIRTKARINERYHGSFYIDAESHI